MDPKQEIVPILEEIRSIIRRSEHSQRAVEKEAGFSKGYLSQLLVQNLDLKMWHLLAILDVFDIRPKEFFERLDPGRTRQPALDRFIDRSQPLEPDVDAALGQLYQAGSETLADLRGRLARCEAAVEQLEAGGYVELSQVAAGQSPAGSAEPSDDDAT